jgi:putative ABC transport system permease protein
VPQVSFLDGRPAADATWDLTVSGGKWTGASNDALVPVQLSSAPTSLKAGDSLAVSAPNGTRETLQISGFYDTPKVFGSGDALGGVIVPQETATRLGGANTALIYSGHAPVDRIAEVATALGKALPQTSLISQTQLNQAANRIFDGLFTFAVGLAGLALVAGTILIANAVGLAMVERRREMGILKAVGFTASRVLGTLLIENAMLGLLGGALGMVGVGIAIWWINNAQPQANLSLSPLLVLLMIGVSIALAMLSAALVAWRPTHIRPLEVLRNE